MIYTNILNKYSLFCIRFLIYFLELITYFMKKSILNKKVKKKKEYKKSIELFKYNIEKGDMTFL
ncbi:hypothetical protein CNEO_44231 [Clostridium neonatale]|uniref:Uncharacterized protein n=1 Tax=Clostridium neonatale TaxID=137838 RepID=A0AA86JRS6_9CLOT|nr:hypothetical protein CNEO_44231 [Clostridium neonatale]